MTSRVVYPICPIGKYLILFPDSTARTLLQSTCEYVPVSEREHYAIALGVLACIDVLLMDTMAICCGVVAIVTHGVAVYCAMTVLPLTHPHSSGFSFLLSFLLCIVPIFRGFPSKNEISAGF